MSDMPMPRQDSVADQMNDVLTMANKAGCYDAADWIAERFGVRTLSRSELRARWDREQDSE